MATGNSDSISMAVFCDFENVALGVRDAQYEQFDIRPVLERLLVKGSIVVKKAYCDWDRYKGFKNAMHEANFELIEIPHVRHSGKNSADIRLVVDALDLCYTKSHVDTFVIISGDSDFSPLVSKLRENAKQVIGVGVKQSTSDLLIANCDEFIFYDDLVREQARRSGRQSTRDAGQGKRSASPEDNRPRREDLETRRAQALEIAMETYDALSSERGDGSKLWASVLKDAIKRRRPDFNESYYGFRAFGNLLEDAQTRGLLHVGRDERSGTYVWRDGSTVAPDTPAQHEDREERADRAERLQEGSDPSGGAGSDKARRSDERRDERRDKDKRQGDRKKRKDEHRHGDTAARERHTEAHLSTEPADGHTPRMPSEDLTPAPARSQTAAAQIATTQVTATQTATPEGGNAPGAALPAEETALAEQAKPARRSAARPRNGRNTSGGGNQNRNSSESRDTSGHDKHAESQGGQAHAAASPQTSQPATGAPAAAPATPAAASSADSVSTAPLAPSAALPGQTSAISPISPETATTNTSKPGKPRAAAKSAKTARPSKTARAAEAPETAADTDTAAAAAAAPAKKTSRRKPKAAAADAPGDKPQQ
ncbi:NYN domain-containing protein [Kerstersia sp.]|uniref:NYN domain-containing protein n=1 Tax=Kerstersia sp. TaxID=1930783 RepID=UPI003F8F118E